MSVPLDVRYGFRKLSNTVGFTAVAVACLARGICASVTVFSVVDTLLLRPFPGVVEPARIVSLAGKPQDLGVAGEQYSLALSYPTYQRYRSLSRSFAGLVAYFSLPLNLAGTGEPLRVSGQIVTDNYFTVLGLESSLGRLFSPGEGAREKQPEAVIGYDLWRRVFGGRPTALGRTLDLNGRAFVVVGVAPRGCHG